MPTEEIRFDSDGCPLAGTYTEVAEPVATALLLPGSGRTDRDSDVRRLKLGITRELADALGEVGVSTLRFDKRGVGASGGDYLTTGMTRRRDDARAALAWLADRAPGLPPLVVGHSEGALHAAELATEPGVAGVALLSMGARSGEDMLGWQTRMIATRLPRPARIITTLFRIDIVRKQRRNMEKIRASTADVIRLQGTRVNARWFREFMAYDPRPALARIRVPVLAITGEHDVQVPPEDVETMRELVPGPFEGHVPARVSHLLRPDLECKGVRDYRRQARQPVSKEVLTLVKDWVARHWAGAARR